MRVLDAMGRRTAEWALVLAASTGLAAAALVAPAIEAQTQPRPQPAPQVAPDQPPVRPTPGAPRQLPVRPVTPTTPQITVAPEATETIQADVSSRTVSIEHDFAGARIILFGNIENSKQTAAEAGLYDIVVVLEGPEERFVVRKKDRKAGIWVNSASVAFQNVPSFYAMVSTRPLDEVAPEPVRDRYQIGFQHVYMELAPGQGAGLVPTEIDDFRRALVRLKQTEGLYREVQYGIAFIGRSLFRTTIDLPANVPVGTFRARVFLFRDGKFLSRYTAPLKLERAGIERAIYSFATRQPFMYGVGSVVLAVGAGLLASLVFSKRAGH